MIPNNNLSVLPFYTSVDKQDHRKDYAFSEMFKNLCPHKFILPFQIIRSTRVNPIQSIKLKGHDFNFDENITEEAGTQGLSVKAYPDKGYDVIKYPGYLPLSFETPEGLYYVEISDGVDTWFSDVFNIVRKVDDLLCIEYWDEGNIEYSGGEIDFSSYFKYRIFLPTQVGKPSYLFTEEVETRDGKQFIEKQISEKVYNFTFLAPEYLLDAMRVIRMADHVFITSRGETYEVDQFLPTPNWLDQGHLASVEVEFNCDTILKKIGKGVQNYNKLRVFNNDFNNDFQKTQ